MATACNEINFKIESIYSMDGENSNLWVHNGTSDQCYAKKDWRCNFDHFQSTISVNVKDENEHEHDAKDGNCQQCCAKSPIICWETWRLRFAYITTRSTSFTIEHKFIWWTIDQSAGIKKTIVFWTLNHLLFILKRLFHDSSVKGRSQIGYRRMIATKIIVEMIDWNGIDFKHLTHLYICIDIRHETFHFLDESYTNRIDK